LLKDFDIEKPPINTDVLILVKDGEIKFFDVGLWNGDINGFCKGWETNSDGSKYCDIIKWDYLPPID